MTLSLAVVGLGIMGSRLAIRLLAAGHRVAGFDVDEDRMGEFEKVGGIRAGSPAEAARGCPIVILSLLNSEISREVCLGPGGVVECDDRPLVVLDTTTGRPADAIEIARTLGESGIDHADMTLSGNAAVAERGELVVMFGGSEAAFRTARPVIDAIARSSHHVGASGSGARAKLIVNHVLAVNRAALAEGLVAAELAGIDLASMLEVLADGAAYSRAMDLWGERMVEGNHDRPNARLRQSLKDAHLIVEHASELAAPTDFVRLVAATLEEGVLNGLGDLDNSSVIEVLRRRASIGRVAPVSGSVAG